MPAAAEWEEDKKNEGVEDRSRRRLPFASASVRVAVAGQGFNVMCEWKVCAAHELATRLDWCDWSEGR